MLLGAVACVWSRDPTVAHLFLSGPLPAQLFAASMVNAERATFTGKRVNNIITTLTYAVYRYINRGLYERDRLAFVLIVALKILLVAERLPQSAVNAFLKVRARRAGGLRAARCRSPPHAIAPHPCRPTHPPAHLARLAAPRRDRL